MRTRIYGLYKKHTEYVNCIDRCALFRETFSRFCYNKVIRKHFLHQKLVICLWFMYVGWCVLFHKVIHI